MAYLEVMKNIEDGNFESLKTVKDIDNHIEQLKA